MARIPVTVGSRGLETGGVINYPTGDPVGRALEGVGKQITDVATVAIERKEKQERFAALMGWDEFNTNMLAETDKAKQGMKPGAVGLHDDLVQKYDQSASDWIAKQPQHLRPEFQARIQAKRAQYSRSAALLENEESQRFQLDGIGNGVKNAGGSILSGGPQLVEGFTREIDERIDASTLPPAVKEEAKRRARQDLQEQGYRSLLARDPKAAQAVAAGWGLGQGGVDQVVDRIIGAESGGRADAKNENSTATGAGQFIERTWLDMVKRNRPDVAQGKSDEQILSLRTNAALSREMTRAYATENAGKLAAAGLPQTPGNIYLSHFLGPDTARKVLQADPNAPIASLVGADAIAANRSVLAGKSAGQVAAWASGKVGGGGEVAPTSADPRFAALTPEKRWQLAGMADLEIRKTEAANAQAATRDYNARYNDLSTRIIDNQATMADVAAARSEGWLTDAGDIQKLTGQIAQRDKGMADTQAFARAMNTPGFAWNPVDKEHKDIVDAGFKAAGGDMKALQTITDRTGVMPASAAVTLRGGLLSSNPTQVENSLQVAGNLVAGKNPSILLSVDGGKDLTDAALTFREYVYGRGMPAAEAAKRVMEERTPEFEQKVRAKIKSEDTNAIVKKNLNDGDIRAAFDTSFLGLAPNPSLAFSPETRVRAMGDYEAAFRDHYARNGDIGVSKKLAIEEMKRTWGVSNVSGSSTVMKFPPERSPVYAGVEDAGARFATQAIGAIKEANGVDVDRKNLVIMESRGTAERFVRGEPPTYTVGYKDKNGLVQFMPKPFFADPAAMRTAQTDERGQRFDVARRAAEATEAAGLDGDISRAPLGVRQF